MKILFYLLITIFSIQNLCAQVSGIIINAETKQPLAYASVYLSETKIGTLTNTEGDFQLTLKGNSDKLIIRYIGFEEKQITITKDTNILIELKPSFYKLSAVNVVNLSNKRLIEIIRKSIDNQTFNYNSIICKSFARINTYQDDTLLREDFEAFFNTTVNTFNIEKNSFKNGLLLDDKSLDVKLFKTVDLFSTIIPNMEVYSPIKISGSDIIATLATKNEDLKTIINSPINTHFASELKDGFILNAEIISDKYLKIIYSGKIDTASNGYIIIDKNANIISKIYNSYFYRNNIPIVTDNPNYEIKNLLLTTVVLFRNDSVNNYPRLITMDFKFDYVHKKSQKIEKITIYAKQMLYDHNSQFSDPLPKYLEVYNDYQLLSIVPIMPKLWQTESTILKTNDESEKAANMLNTKYNISYLSAWKKDWQFKWYVAAKYKPKKADKLKIRKAHIIKPDVFILLNYNNTNGKYEVTTAAVFDYKKSYLPPELRTEGVKVIIEKYFNNINKISESLKQNISKESDITEKLILKHYKNSEKEIKKARKVFLKEQRRYMIKWLKDGEK